MCWGSDDYGSVDGPNGSSDLYGFPPAQLFLLRKTIDGFNLRTSLPRTLDGYVDKATVGARQGATSPALARRSSRSSRPRSSAGGRLTNDQGRRSSTPSTAIRASLGCS